MLFATLGLTRLTEAWSGKAPDSFIAFSASCSQ
jgi:hypothetical protein